MIWLVTTWSRCTVELARSWLELVSVFRAFFLLLVLYINGAVILFVNTSVTLWFIIAFSQIQWGFPFLLARAFFSYRISLQSFLFFFFLWKPYTNHFKIYKIKHNLKHTHFTKKNKLSNTRLAIDSMYQHGNHSCRRQPRLITSFTKQKSVLRGKF